jgi:hypothetical protein
MDVELTAATSGPSYDRAGWAVAAPPVRGVGRRESLRLSAPGPADRETVAVSASPDCASSQVDAPAPHKSRRVRSPRPRAGKRPTCATAPLSKDATVFRITSQPPLVALAITAALLVTAAPASAGKAQTTCAFPDVCKTAVVYNGHAGLGANARH